MLVANGHDIKKHAHRTKLQHGENNNNDALSSSEAQADYHLSASTRLLHLDTLYEEARQGTPAA